MYVHEYCFKNVCTCYIHMYVHCKRFQKSRKTIENQINFMMDYSSYNDKNIIDLVCESAVHEYFDQVIGNIEDIVLSAKFQKLHAEFLELHWSKFENKEENKLECMTIFEEYTTTFESFFMEELSQRMDGFDMEKFVQELNLHENLPDSLDIIDSEIFELLYSFNNFQIFKDQMLDYRFKKEGLLQHLECNILVTKSLKQEVDLSETEKEDTYVHVN